MNRIARIVVLVVLAGCVASAAVAADWTGWLGPANDGTSTEKNVFGEADPKLSLAWSKPLGKAYSAIAVADGKAVTMFADGETDWLVAMNASTGDELWRFRVDEMFPKIGGADGGQLSMPVIDAGVVYALGARGQLYAVKLADGKQIWSLRIDEKLGARQPHFGFTTTPLVVGNLLFVQTGGDEGRSLSALDKQTGKLRWSIGDEMVGYQSPVLVEMNGHEQIVAVTNTSILGLEPKGGKVLWRAEHGLVAQRDGWSTPIRIAPDTFLLTARDESAAFTVRSGDGGVSVEEAWRGTTIKGNFAMPVAHDGSIYGYSGEFLTCIDAANGKQRWKSRSDAAGLVLVDGHLVIFGSEGDVIVAEASPEAYEERTRLKVAEEGGVTYPAFSDGGIFVRNLKTIARVDVQ